LKNSKKLEAVRVNVPPAAAAGQDSVDPLHVAAAEQADIADVGGEAAANRQYPHH
jgi:hypothetical protein